MLGFLYIICKKYIKPKKTCKIGSTLDFVKRMGAYVTPEDEFNNMTHDIWCIQLLDSKFTCYELDEQIQIAAQKDSMPYQKYNGSGGTEHYYFNDDPDKLIHFLETKMDTRCVLTKINVNKLRDEIKKWSIGEIYESCVLDETKKKMIKQCFKLKQYQTDMRNAIVDKKSKERLFHLIVSPTGTGKTIVFVLACLDSIQSTKKSVMILTKRKEILDQMNDCIMNYVKLFKSSGLTTVGHTDVQIVDCLEHCSIDKINQKSDKPQIYIINFDKFTSSNKMKKFDRIDFIKFDLIVVDESHWCGADAINAFMTKIKTLTKVNVIGFSATPLRCQKWHRDKTEKLFSNDKQHLNLLYEYSYYDALINNNICPIEWCPMMLEQDDLIEEDRDDEDGKKCKILNSKSYAKVWKHICDNIINISFRKKGILWFRTRRDLLMFYLFMKHELKDFKVFCSISYEKGDDAHDMVLKCELDKEHLDSAIGDFCKYDKNALLFAVNRATEGFNDDTIDFCCRMYYSTTIDPVTETQRMGRLNRWYKNDPSQKKKGMFVTLEIANIEEMRKSIIARLKSWITFARSYNGGNKSDSDKKNEQMMKIINTYVNAEILETYKIDIKDDVINAMHKRVSELVEVKRNLMFENKRRKNLGIEIISKCSQYDVWALDNNHLICDELEEVHGFIDWKWFFGLCEKDYMGFAELKALCRKNRDKLDYVKPYDVYVELQEGDDMMPQIDMLKYVYSEYKTMNDLFAVGL